MSHLPSQARLLPWLLLPACLPEKSAPLPCGEGTHEEDGACVADEPTDDSGDPTGEGEGETGGEGEGETGGEGEGEGESETGGEGEGEGEGETGGEGEGEGEGEAAFDVCATGAPFTTIQDAVDAASDGAVIRVCAGVYSEVYIGRADLTIQGEDAEETIIYSTSGPALEIDDVEVDISGFTIGGVGTTSSPGAIALNDTEGTLHDLMLTDNSTPIVAQQTGGDMVWDNVVFRDNVYPKDAYTSSVQLYVLEGDAEVSHCTFQGNTSNVTLMASDANIEVHNNLLVSNDAYYVGVFSTSAGGDFRFFNNVVVGNALPSSGSYVLLTGLADIRNNVIASNSGGSALTYRAAATDYNVVWDNDAGSSLSGTGNVASDPRLVDADAGDFHLTDIYSPAIDAGDPETRYDDVDGTRNDIGAYGGPDGEW